MQIFIYDTEKEIGQAAGKIFVDHVKANPNAAMGFATGMTPVPTYDYMAGEYEKGNVSFAGMKTFNLDEYCDLPREHKNSFYTFMMDNLFSRIDVKPENINFLDGNAPDQSAESERYAQAIIDAGGIDVQFLGIGRNGHIAFNEPAGGFTGEAFKVKLTDSTIEANSIYFDDIAMPRYAMTMGIGSIMRAKKIVFVATGASKAEAVKAMVQGEVTPECPASILQTHDDVTVFLDRAASQGLGVRN
ncbi:MAG: glucosamine-6-phosphate deaminase [Oscillospiraceae bacterium]|nr:glucosamine-6-phosphate deaminase [Oscillospiraceae bacterium]